MSPANFSLESMSIKDVERVLKDVLGTSLEFQIRETNLISGATWARRENDYLLSIHPGELEGAGQHYMLFWRGHACEACTHSSFSNKLALVGFKHDETLRKGVEDSFISALGIYGRWGRGQDGQFNTQLGHTDEIFNSISPIFEKPRHEF